MYTTPYPAVGGAGVQTITYTFIDTNGCVNSMSDNVEVFALPLVSFTALADLCVDAGIQFGVCIASQLHRYFLRT